MLISKNGPIIDRTKIPKNPFSIYSERLNPQELSHLSAKELQKEDSINPLPIQRLYYLNKEQSDAIIPTTYDEDKEYFNKELVNTSFTRDRMSMTIEKIQKGLKTTWTAKNKEEFFSSITKSVLIVTRKEEEDYLRTSIENERNCIRDSQCEGNKIPGAKPVTLTEYLDPAERLARKQKGTLPTSRRNCVMCNRFFAAYNFINLKSECTTIPHPNIVITKRGNIVDVDGEYPSELALMTNSKEYQAMPVPVVLHIRSYYQQKVIDGVTWYIQHPSCYRKPEDIRNELFI